MRMSDLVLSSIHKTQDPAPDLCHIAHTPAGCENGPLFGEATANLAQSAIQLMYSLNKVAPSTTPSKPAAGGSSSGAVPQGLASYALDGACCLAFDVKVVVCQRLRLS